MALTPEPKPGLYAAASLSGASADPRALAALSLGTAPTSSLRAGALGLHLRLHDPQPAALSLHRTPAELTAFVGYLDEPEDAAAVAKLPTGSSAAAIAAAIFNRHGPETPNRLLGEWTLLHWHSNSRTLTLVGSAARRDRQYFVHAGGMVLLAPDPLLLGRLAPGGLVLSPLGFLREHARAPLRLQARELTPWQHVEVLAPATLLRFTAGGCERAVASPLEPPEPWRGSFEDAVEQIDTLGRRIVRQHLGRHPQAAFLLSGGQDSTLLSAWGALERSDLTPSLALCSVAPPGSGLADESRPSRETARHLGMPWHGVWPAAEADLFCPDPALFAFAGSPMLGNRAALYDALGQEALASGASALLDGAWGEASVTGGKKGAPRPGIQGFVRHLLRAVSFARLSQARGSSPSPTWPADFFLAQFSPDLLAQAPPEWQQLAQADPAVQSSRPSGQEPSRNGCIGLGSMLLRSSTQSTATRGGLRHLYPFRDRRLVLAAAALPRSFQSHAGVSRALSRALLQGRVPEQVRLAQAGGPFSPDFVPRLRRQAATARQRVPRYEAAGCAAFLDLTWLAERLAHIEREPSLPADLLYRTQQTAIAAEFLLWAATN